MAKKGEQARPKAPYKDPTGRKRRINPVAPGPPEPPEGDLPPEGLIPLDEDEQRFVEEWLIDRNPTQAYRRINPLVCWITAHTRGTEMAARPHVRAEIRAARRAQALRCQVKADEVLKEIARLAYSDILELFDPGSTNLRAPRHIPYETRKAIASVTVSRERRSVTTSGRTRTTVTEQVIAYKLWNKNDALQKLATYLGLKTAIPPIESVLAMLPLELQEQIREAMQKQNEPTAVPPLPPPKPN